MVRVSSSFNYEKLMNYSTLDSSSNIVLSEQASEQKTSFKDISKACADCRMPEAVRPLFTSTSNAPLGA